MQNLVFSRKDQVDFEPAELQPLVWFEPQHDKTYKMTCAPMKTHISLVAKDPMLLHVDSEDSNQTGQMPMQIWVFAGRTHHSVGFVMLRLKILFSYLLRQTGEDWDL